ncbi:MAG TPA: NUDIX domain-containing protein [Longimicrobiaceae bacterium]
MAFLGEFIAGYVGQKVLDHVLGLFRARGPVPRWDAAIERAVPDIRIHGVVTAEPQIRLLGRVDLSGEEAAEAAAIRAELEINDPHAMLVEPPQVHLDPVQLRARTLDYAELEALRRRDRHGPVVTAGAVVVCPEKRVVVLHHRSRDSRTFPDHLHVIGGSYQPPVRDKGVDDHLSLRSAAQREVQEEIGAVITLDNNPPMLLAEERSERFFQCIVLGAQISASQLSRLRQNWEAEGLVQVPYDQLQKLLVSPPVPWVPTGKGHVLAWLAHGAPGAGRRAKFAGRSAAEVFGQVLS